MLTPIKLKVLDHKVFMVSDLHIKHAKVVPKRGFDSGPDHDNGVIHSINEVCDADSYLFSLGDIISDDPKGQHLKVLLRRLTFDTIFMQAGNHDSGFKALYREALVARFPDAMSCGQQVYEVYPLEMMLDDGPKRIVFLPDYAEVWVNKQLCVLSHYPIVSHNRMSRGAWHLTGHSHGNCHLTNKDTGRGFRLDVSWESFRRPISVSDIRRHLAGRDIDAWDHHGASADSPDSS